MFSSPAFFFNLPILISCQSIPPACANFTSYLNIALGLVFEITPSSFQTRNITVPDSCFLDTWPTPSGCGQQKYKDPPIPVSVLSKLLVHKSTYAWTPKYTFREGYGTSEEDDNMVDAVCILCTFASSHCHKKIIHQMWGGQEFQFLGPWCPDRNLAVALMPLQPGSRQQRISPNIAILWEAAFYFFQNSFSNFPFYPTLPNFPPPKVAVSFHLPCDTQVLRISAFYLIIDVSKVFQNSWILVVSKKSIKPSRVFSAASSWSCSPQ